jgi:NADPH-dependent glutamate synthase beta subunit-like oxidoreductase
LKNEIARIVYEGARIITNRPLSRNFIAEARENYAAVFIGCGHGRAAGLGIPGEETTEIDDGLEFLAGIRRGETPKCEGLCAVIGGGNTAIDVARNILRLGGKALILYRRRHRDMPASPDEVDAALEEGVELRELLAPAKITKEGKGLRITMRPMKVVGEEAGGRARVEPDGRKTLEFRVRRVFRAAGAGAAEDWMNPPEKGRGVVSLNGCILVNRPKAPVVVFRGDLTNGTKTVVHAVASGKAAAMALDTYFREGLPSIRKQLKRCAVGNGEALSMEIYMGGDRRLRNPHVVRYSEINTDYFHFAPRITQPRLLKEERLRSFEEIDLKISANLAIREAERCFNCGVCNRCDNCYLFCPDLSVIREAGTEGRKVNYDYCKGCGLCVVECPRNAMTLEEEKR